MLPEYRQDYPDTERALVTRGTLLPVRTRPHDDELLSSWVWRVAAGNGLKYSVLCGDLFSSITVERCRWRTWDLDRNATDAHFRVLSQVTAVSQRTLRSLSFRRDAAGLSTSVESLTSYPGTWLIPSSPMQSLAGPQWCVACLAESSHIRREWRLAFVTACRKHGEPLVNRCDSCAKRAKRYTRSIDDSLSAQINNRFQCRECAEESRSIDFAQSMLPPVLRLQTALHQVMDEATIGNSKTDVRAFSGGLRTALNFLVQWKDASENIRFSDRESFCFEQEQISLRFDLMHLLARTVGNRVIEFVRTCERLGRVLPEQSLVGRCAHSETLLLFREIQQAICSSDPAGYQSLISNFSCALTVLSNMLPIGYYSHTMSAKRRRRESILKQIVLVRRSSRRLLKRSLMEDAALTI
jgi:hypothetical protein